MKPKPKKPTKAQIEETAKEMHEYARAIYKRRGIFYEEWQYLNESYKEGNRVIARWHLNQLNKAK
jgi:hypothetical protein